MSHHTDHKSPDEIEREVEEARARLRFTIDEIREQMSPGRMLDQAIDYARASGGAEFSRNLGRQVRDNPLPIALIGAGIGWLMSVDRNGRAHDHDDGHLSARRMSRGAHEGGYDTGRSSGWGVGSAMHSAASGVGSAAHGVGSAAGSVASGVGSAASSVASAVSSAASSVASAVTGAVGAIGSGASSAGHRVGEMGHDMRDGMGHYGSAVSDRAHGAMDQAGRLGTTGYERVSRAIEDQPMILGAIGLAVGALIGAALPSTRMENRAFGSTADRLRDQASDLARDGMEQARSAAREAMQEVSAVASDLDTAGTERASDGNGSAGGRGSDPGGETASARRVQNGTGASHAPMASPLDQHERRDHTRTPS